MKGDGCRQETGFVLLLYQYPTNHVTTRPSTYMKEAARKVEMYGVEVV
jgi:hypothetical protein